jgi:hypothetical protein
LPEFNQGVTRNVSQTGGWFGFSNASNGNGSSLAFVTAKSSSGGGYSDYRWGTALGTGNIRDATIFSKRQNPGPSNLWELVGGQGIRGRYFIVVDSSIEAIASQILARGLVAASSVERFTFTEAELTNINYNFSANPGGNYSAVETASQNASLSVKPKPFLGSYPVYLLSTATESRITANLYYYSLKPYDGKVTSIKLLGYTTTALDLNPATLSVEKINTYGKLKLIPNPVKDKFTLNREVDYGKIYSMEGQTIHITYKNSEFDVSNLAKGVYFLEVFYNHTKQTLKFIVN